MMNNVELIGYISSPIDVKTTNGMQFTNVVLSVQREEGGKFDTIPCVAIDQCVEQLKESIKSSNLIKIEGAVRTRNPNIVEIFILDVKPSHSF
ncbi:single-stranded DNA-binding protein [Lysinibacillus sp. 1P01SD]|uniref:single-stranded DNA-binding protein n=1 Tax=Lysinibacillus sp. 1P01SD TaxID=3132285 RepID=UPI0039A13991